VALHVDCCLLLKVMRFQFLAHLLMRSTGEEDLCFADVLFKKIFVVISVRLIISTSAELIFTGFVELWSEINNLNFFFNPSRYVAVATNFVGKIDLQYSPCSLCNIR